MQSSNSEIITSLYNEWRRDIDSIFPGVKHNSQNTLIVLKNKIVLRDSVQNFDNLWGGVWDHRE